MEKFKRIPKKYKLLIVGSLVLIPTIAVAAVMATRKTSKTEVSSNNEKKTEEVKSNKLGADLTYLEGDVEYKESQGWLTAKQGADLKEGSSVRVLSKGRAILTIDDGSVLRLDTDSAITFTSLDPKNIVISNDKGSVYSRVAKSERVFVVKAGDVQYKSLGTAYRTVNKDDKKGVDVYHSKVEVTNAKTKVVVDQGKKYYVKDSESKDNENKTASIDLASIKSDSFLKWNREQDFKLSEYKDELGVMEDTSAPSLEISSPVSSSTTTDTSVAVSGKTEVGAKVFVNGNEVENKDGNFETTVELQIGENKLTIKSIDSSSNEVVKEIVVVREEIAQPTPAPTQEVVVETPQPTTAPVVEEPQSGIYLAGSATDGGIVLNWDVVGVTIDQGFKVVKSTSNPNPSYPDDNPTYIGDSSARIFAFDVKDGKTYYFRVCKYTGNGCTNYSNSIQVTAPQHQVEEPEGGATSISVSHAGAKTITWSTVGIAKQGYKLLWSKNSGPTYPTRSGDHAAYYSNPEHNSGEISKSDGPGTYYVRVCAYKDGACYLYSNEIAVVLN